MLKIRELAFIAGKVIKIEAGRGNAAGILQVITLETNGYDSEKKTPCKITYECAFWNKGDKLRADRVVKMKVKTGNYIVIEGFISAEDPTKITGISLGYAKTTFNITQEGKSPVVIYFGYVGFAEERDNSKGAALRASFRTQESGYQNEHWTGITFQDHTFDDGTTSTLFEKAKKLMHKGNLVLLRCSEICPYESNGKTYYSAFGQNFDIIQFAKKENDAPASKSEPEIDLNEPDLEEDEEVEDIAEPEIDSNEPDLEDDEGFPFK